MIPLNHRPLASCPVCHQTECRCTNTTDPRSWNHNPTAAQVVAAVAAFHIAAVNLLKAWEDYAGQDDARLLLTSYPFDKSFDEVVSDIAAMREEIAARAEAGQ